MGEKPWQAALSELLVELTGLVADGRELLREQIDAERVEREQRQQRRERG